MVTISYELEGLINFNPYLIFIIEFSKICLTEEEAHKNHLIKVVLRVGSRAALCVQCLETASIVTR